MMLYSPFRGTSDSRSRLEALRAKRAAASSAPTADTSTSVPPAPISTTAPAHGPSPASVSEASESSTATAAAEENSRLAELRAKRAAAASAPAKAVSVSVPAPVQTHARSSSPSSAQDSQTSDDNLTIHASTSSKPSAVPSQTKEIDNSMLDRSALTAAINAATSGMQREVAQLRDQIEELNMTIETLALDKEQLAIELEMAQEKLSSSGPSVASTALACSGLEETLRAENDRLREALKVLQARHQDQLKEQQNQDAKLSASELFASTERNRELEIEVGTLRARVFELTESAETAGLEDMVETLSLKNDELVAQLRQLQGTVSDLEASQELDAEIEAAQRQEIESLRDSESRLSSCLRATEEMNERKTAELSETIEKYRSACEIQKLEIANLQHRIDTLEPPSGDTTCDDPNLKSTTISQLLVAPFKSICWDAVHQPVDSKVQLLRVQLMKAEQRLAESTRELDLLRASLPLQALPDLSSELQNRRLETRIERLCVYAAVLLRAFTVELSASAREIDKRANRDHLRSIWRAVSALIDTQAYLVKIMLIAVAQEVGVPQSSSFGRILHSSAGSLRLLEDCFNACLVSIETCTKGELIWPETTTAEELQVFASGCQSFSESMSAIFTDNSFSSLPSEIFEECRVRIKILDDLRDSNHAYFVSLVMLRALSYAIIRPEEKSEDSSPVLIQTALNFVTTSRHCIDEQSRRLFAEKDTSQSQDETGKYRFCFFSALFFVFTNSFVH